MKTTYDVTSASPELQLSTHRLNIAVPHHLRLDLLPRLLQLGAHSVPIKPRIRPRPTQRLLGERKQRAELLDLARVAIGLLARGKVLVLNVLVGELRLAGGGDGEAKGLGEEAGTEAALDDAEVVVELGRDGFFGRDEGVGDDEGEGRVRGGERDGGGQEGGVELAVEGSGR